MQCPLCNYQLADFDTVADCPKCHGRGTPKLAPTPVQPPPSLPYNPTIPRPAPEPPRQKISSLAIGALVLVPVVAVFAALNFFGMEIKPKSGDAPIAAPTSVAVAAPTMIPALAFPVATPEAAATKVPASSKTTSRAQPPESAPMSTGALSFGKEQSFGDYSAKTLALIDVTENPRQLRRIGLDLYAMSAEANREKERAQVSGGRALMWNYASSLFESLGSDAVEKVKFLDGRTFPEAYRAEARGRSHACAQFARAADSLRPKSQKEQEGAQILRDLNQQMAPKF